MILTRADSTLANIDSDLRRMIANFATNDAAPDTALGRAVQTHDFYCQEILHNLHMLNAYD